MYYKEVMEKISSVNRAADKSTKDVSRKKVQSSVFRQVSENFKRSFKNTARNPGYTRSRLGQCIVSTYLPVSVPCYPCKYLLTRLITYSILTLQIYWSRFKLHWPICTNSKKADPLHSFSYKNKKWEGFPSLGFKFWYLGYFHATILKSSPRSFECCIVKLLQEVSKLKDGYVTWDEKLEKLFL